MVASIKVVQAACPHDCPDTCAMRVTVENGRAVDVRGDPDHPPTNGALCTKVARYTQRTYHADRLLEPLIRTGPKGSGAFAPIGWDEALDIAADRLGQVARRNPEAIVPYSYAGTMGLVQGEGMAARFFNKIGASMLDRTICATAGMEALRHTYGGSVGMHLEFFEESRLILIWGSNPIVSSVHFWMRAQEARRRGAMLIAIDPYRSLTAEKCDQHIAILPGTDAALALAIAHVLIVEDLVDHDYIARYAAGYDALRERAMAYSPERAAGICGIDAQTIVTLAREYGTTRPASIRVNYGMQRARGGGNAVRAIACLPSLIGAWRDRAGGLLLSSSSFAPVAGNALARPDLLPNWPRLPRAINMNQIGDALLAPGGGDFGPRIEALVVYNSNPVAVAPDSAKVAAGFAREDLFTIVLEHFRTDTVDYADLVFPATTQLEHLDVHKSYGHTYVLLNKPAIAPVGQARPNADVFRQLAARMGLDEPCLRDSDEDIARQALQWSSPALAGADWEALAARGWLKLNVPDAPFAQGGFPTPSGKCEFYASRLAQQGMDPVPDYIPPYESVASSPALAARFPLAFISPPGRNFMNSTFVNVESLRAADKEPYLDIHAADAGTRGIVHGAMVRIFNDRGAFLAKARVGDRSRQGVVVAPSVWWKKLAPGSRNANEVTSQALADLGGGATFYDCLVDVAPAQTGAAS
jgi:anaerobic selenocysteine-containing dehydrogenase